MEYRKLPDTDIQISVLAQGCWSFAGDDYWAPQDDRDSIATVHSALEEGVNFFDRKLRRRPFRKRPGSGSRRSPPSKNSDSGERFALSASATSEHES